MNQIEFETQLKKEFNALDNQIEQFEIYKVFLQKQNEIHNLTRLDSNELIYGSYFYDSIYPYKDLDWNNIHEVLDVGSGSGIPGIALKILYPHIHLTIVESVTKKTIFLQQLVDKLKLDNVFILNTRAEELDKSYKNKFDLTTARAVAEIKIILELLIPFMKINGLCVLPKGKKGSEEMQNASHIIKKLKIQLIEKIQYNSLENHKEFIYIFTKKEDTPSIYPRKWKSIINNSKEKEEEN